MKKIIGRKDKADFPDLGLEDVAIKIDTGAYTSSIHCSDFEAKDGVLYAYFSNENKSKKSSKRIAFPDYKEAKVKSSNGIIQRRYLIKSRIKLFGKLYKISLTLADRKKMKNPVLIGRKFLNKKFIVDTDKQNISFKLKSNEH